MFPSFAQVPRLNYSFEVSVCAPCETKACFNYCNGNTVLYLSSALWGTLLFTPAISYDRHPCLQMQRTRSFSEFPKEPQTTTFLCAAERPEKRQERSTWASLRYQHHMEEIKIQVKKQQVI